MKSSVSIELLAPAKNIEFGKAAINHGADAVYIGYSRFGAREAAGNSLSDIEALINYAHFFHARVYVTINTILYNSELEEVQQLIHQLYNIGTDAIIIQDMGILEMNLPPIPLHASTQTHNFQLERISFLEKVGFSRVILARELSINEIDKIKRHTNIELEAFVHGALCVSFSGQCYLSQALANRSANRGVCAQPCRSSFDLVDENGNILQKDKHLLSLRDLNQSSNIESLIDAGVTTFKIEGRLKDIEYVKNITAYYRKEIDKILGNRPHAKRASSGSVEIAFEPNPLRSFNRGFTSHFAHGRQNNMATHHTQKAIGQLLGKVIRVENNWFSIESDFDVANDDGLCFFSEKKRLVGIKVNRVESNRIYPLDMNGLYEGAQIFRNSDKAFTNLLKRNVSSRFFACEISIEPNKNGLTITLIDEDNLCTSLTQILTLEPANEPQKAKQTIETQLSKTGEFPFRVTKVQVKVADRPTPFVTLSQLNSLRRKLFETHSQNRIQKHPRETKTLIPNSHPYPQSHIDFRANVSNRLAEKFYQRHGVNTIEPAFELQSQIAGEKVMTMRYCILHELGYCNGKEKQPKTPKKLFLKDNNKTYPLHFDCKNCEMSIIFPH